MPPEVAVRLEGPGREGGGDDLDLSVDGRPIRMSLKVGALSARLVATLPEVLHDLLDIAATVYAADCAVSRGGATGAGFGREWHRTFRLAIPVRCPAIWQRSDVQEMLRETLGFLSDDTWHFAFRPRIAGGPTQGIFDYGLETGFRPERVVMFSGGLDSLAGALEALVEQDERVVLVSHNSATKIARVQRDLVAAMRDRLGSGRMLHVSVTAQLRAGARKEGTQRSRSFLFAALGLAVAEMFGLASLRFYENGVVSLNLPPLAQVIGARATRTTHPAVLARLGRLFSAVLGGPRQVSNPYLYRTKPDILDTIVRLGFADQIRFTHSCADVHNRTNMHSHCGRCSQCIDRRFAVLVRGLQDADPAESYAVDLLDGPRQGVTDREMILAYVRNARFFALATPAALLDRFPELAQALGETGERAGDRLNRLHDLHRRHGAGVTGVVEAALATAPAHTDPDSLLGLYRAAKLAEFEFPGATAESPATVAPPMVTLVLDRARRRAEIARVGALTGAPYRLLDCLAATHLAALGDGRQPEDMPCTTAAHLAEKLDYADEDSVRRMVQRTRSAITKLSAGGGVAAVELIESIFPLGYRLVPEAVRVQLVQPPGPATARRGRPT